jgi:NitT/TauT family transport system permease protein
VTNSAQAILSIETTPESKTTTSWEIAFFGLKQWLKSPAPYLNILGIASFILLWYVTTEYLKLPWFKKLPGPVTTFNEWVSIDPSYGISIYSPEYYTHIFKSIWRVLQAFFLATFFGVPIGLFMGWKKTFKDYTFPLLETLRPIPMLAWVPLSILMWPGREASIIFLTFLGSFFATVLNTLLGVESIDEVYFRAARSLGAKSRQIFFKIILPGALPFIFTGLQISMGFAWFSLVAGEMLAGEYGLGYLIWNSFIMVQYPVIVIAMVTLGVIGWLSSSLIRMVGDRLMQWKVREEAR